MAWKVEVTTFFTAAKCWQVGWKIPKSVNVTDFPFEQLFKYLVYLAKMCCDSDVFLVDGCSWSRYCGVPVGVEGVAGTFSLPLTCVIPHADSCTIICTVRQRHRYKSSSFLLWWLVIVVMRYPQSPNHNQQASHHARIPRIFSVFTVPYAFFLIFTLGLWTCKFFILFPASFANLLQIRRSPNMFNFFHFPYSNFFSFSHQTVMFHMFSANLEKILYIRLCHLASFNVPSCYHLSSPVLKIFVAVSFSF